MLIVCRVGIGPKHVCSMITHALSVAEFNDLCYLGIKDVGSFSISNLRVCWGSYVRLLGVKVVVFGVVCHALEILTM